MNELAIDGRSLRANRQRTTRRGEILQAAQEVISRRGYQATSVADVLEAAGISRGTFYLYFDGIDALFYELVDAFILELMACIRPVRLEHGNPVDQLRDNLTRVVDLLFGKQDLTVILLREAIAFNETVDQKLTKLYLFLHENIARALHNGAKWGLTREVNEELIAMAVLGSIKEVLYQHLVVRRGGEPNRQAIVEELLRFGLMGLQAKH
ncbi:MAG: TetR/AcrR family transcriptional regulator [Pseudomonadota bacterium]